MVQIEVGYNSFPKYDAKEVLKQLSQHTATVKTIHKYRNHLNKTLAMVFHV